MDINTTILEITQTCMASLHVNLQPCTQRLILGYSEKFRQAQIHKLWFLLIGLFSSFAGDEPRQKKQVKLIQLKNEGCTPVFSFLLKIQQRISFFFTAQ